MVCWGTAQYAIGSDVARKETKNKPSKQNKLLNRAKNSTAPFITQQNSSLVAD
jgi:hypothetical protein